MNKRRKTTLPATGLLLAVTALHLPVFADGDGYEWQRDERGTKLGHQLRAATFNASLNRFNAGELVADLAACDEGRIDNDQVRAVVEIIQRSDPDVLLVNEFDYDADGEAARLFPKCLAVSLDRRVKPLRYRDYFVAPSNTGIPSGYDLNNDGSVDISDFTQFRGVWGSTDVAADFNADNSVDITDFTILRNQWGTVYPWY